MVYDEAAVRLSDGKVPLYAKSIINPVFKGNRERLKLSDCLGKGRLYRVKKLFPGRGKKKEAAWDWSL